MSGVILGLDSANERCCHTVPSSLIAWASTQNDFPVQAMEYATNKVNTLSPNATSAGMKLTLHIHQILVILESENEDDKNIKYLSFFKATEHAMG